MADSVQDRQNVLTRLVEIERKIKTDNLPLWGDQFDEFGVYIYQTIRLADTLSDKRYKTALATCLNEFYMRVYTHFKASFNSIAPGIEGHIANYKNHKNVEVAEKRLKILRIDLADMRQKFTSHSGSAHYKSVMGDPQISSKFKNLDKDMGDLVRRIDELRL
jgi:hypothetical protein